MSTLDIIVKKGVILYHIFKGKQNVQILIMVLNIQMVNTKDKIRKVIKSAKVDDIANL